jgi:hypothetical protein
MAIRAEHPKIFNTIIGAVSIPMVDLQCQGLPVPFTADTTLGACASEKTRITKPAFGAG